MSAFLEQSEQGAFCVTFKLVMRIFVEVGVWLTAILHERTQKKAKKNVKRMCSHNMTLTEAHDHMVLLLGMVAQS